MMPKKAPESVTKLALLLILAGSAFTFGLGPDFERPKVLCLGLGLALLLPRVLAQFRDVDPMVHGLSVMCLLSFSLSTVFSLDPARSWIGSFDRSQGWCLCLIALALGYARVPWAVLDAMLRPVCAALCLYAFVQVLGWDPLFYAASTELGFGQRAFATMGNPTLLAAWLVLALPVLVDKKPQNLWLPVICVLAIITTGARAAWLGVLVAGALRLRGFRAGLVGVLFCAAGGVALIGMRPESVGARMSLWQSTLHSMVHPGLLINGLGQADPYSALRPWLGYGLDMQAAVLDRMRTPPAGLSQDRAHQLWLDIYLQLGWLGVLVLAISAGVLLWRLRTDISKQSSFIAVLVTWQFGFLSSASLALLALILGAERNVSNALETAPKFPVPKFTLAKFPAPWLQASALIAAFIAASLLFAPLPSAWLAHVRISGFRTPERAVERFRAGVLQMQTQPQVCAKPSFVEALRLDPWRVDFQVAVESVANGRICYGILQGNR
jgi:hypothetical protein